MLPPRPRVRRTPGVGCGPGTGSAAFAGSSRSAAQRLRLDAAVVELDVEAIARLHGRRRTQHAPVAIANEREAALQHALIAQRAEQLVVAFQVTPARDETVAQGFRGARLQCPGAFAAHRRAAA